MEQAVKERLFASERAVWAATAAYFGYVVLGGISWQLHRHVYTGDDSKSVLENLRNGQVATFRKHVYGKLSCCCAADHIISSPAMQRAALTP
jgi:hypothetical protein